MGTDRRDVIFLPWVTTRRSGYSRWNNETIIAFTFWCIKIRTGMDCRIGHFSREIHKLPKTGLFWNSILLGFSISGFPVDVGAVRARRRRGAMSEPSSHKLSMTERWRPEEITARRRQSSGSRRIPTRRSSVDKIFEQELSDCHAIRCGDRVFSGALPTLRTSHKQDLIAHFKSKETVCPGGLLRHREV